MLSTRYHILLLHLQKPSGIFCLLDEESMFPKATDLSMTQKLVKHCSRSPYFKAIRGQSSSFTILHYAGEVNVVLDRILKAEFLLPVGLSL